MDHGHINLWKVCPSGMSAEEREVSRRETREALDRLANQIDIDAELTKGLESGESIPVDATFWDRQRMEILQRFEADQSRQSK